MRLPAVVIFNFFFFYFCYFLARKDFSSPQQGGSYTFTYTRINGKPASHRNSDKVTFLLRNKLCCFKHLPIIYFIFIPLVVNSRTSYYCLMFWQNYSEISTNKHLQNNLLCSYSRQQKPYIKVSHEILVSIKNNRHYSPTSFLNRCSPAADRRMIHTSATTYRREGTMPLTTGIQSSHKHRIKPQESCWLRSNIFTSLYSKSIH